MKHRLIYFIAIMGFMTWTVLSAAPSKAPLGEDFSLKIGQTVALAGTNFQIKFNAVLEDSRCPLNAFCTMVGNGQVELEILDPEGERKTVLLNTEDTPKTTRFWGINLTLIALNPTRIDGKSISTEDYSITLRAEKSLSN